MAGLVTGRDGCGATERESRREGRHGGRVCATAFLDGSSEWSVRSEVHVKSLPRYQERWRVGGVYVVGIRWSHTKNKWSILVPTLVPAQAVE